MKTCSPVRARKLSINVNLCVHEKKSAQQMKECPIFKFLFSPYQRIKKVGREV